jgi:hypothetical protein
LANHRLGGHCAHSRSRCVKPPGGFVTSDGRTGLERNHFITDLYGLTRGFARNRNAAVCAGCLFPPGTSRRRFLGPAEPGRRDAVHSGQARHDSLTDRVLSSGLRIATPERARAAQKIDLASSRAAPVMQIADRAKFVRHSVRIRDEMTSLHSPRTQPTPKRASGSNAPKPAHHATRHDKVSPATKRPTFSMTSAPIRRRTAGLPRPDTCGVTMRFGHDHSG